MADGMEAGEADSKRARATLLLARGPLARARRTGRRAGARMVAGRADTGLRLARAAGLARILESQRWRDELFHRLARAAGLALLLSAAFRRSGWFFDRDGHGFVALLAAFGLAAFLRGDPGGWRLAQGSRGGRLPLAAACCIGLALLYAARSLDRRSPSKAAWKKRCAGFLSARWPSCWRHGNGKSVGPNRPYPPRPGRCKAFPPSRRQARWPPGAAGSSALTSCCAPPTDA